MREMTKAMKHILSILAIKDCPECDGEGWISISWNNNPDRCEDVTCECVNQRCGPSDEDIQAHVQAIANAKAAH